MNVVGAGCRPLDQPLNKRAAARRIGNPVNQPDLLLLMTIELVFCGAQSENRTRDLRITNALLYRLSYLGAL